MVEKMRRRMKRVHPHWAAVLDWIAVFTATTSFVFIALWAASPDSAMLTIETATLRSLSYSIPITLGMWGITRATRKGSAVPKSMSEAMPYARLGRDGKPMASSKEDDKNGVDPTPIGGGDGS